MKSNKLWVTTVFLFFCLHLSANELSEKIESAFQDVSNSNPYFFIKEERNRSECKIECPIAKDEYFTRISNFNLRTGTTQCYVYKKKTNDILATITNRNDYCRVLFTPEQFNEKIQLKDRNIFSLMSNYEKKFYDNYTNTGTQKFVHLPKYMIAGLTADDSVINVGASIERNEVVMREGYTIYPNAVEQNDYHLVSSVKQGLSNTIVFIMNFMNENNQVLLLIKTFLLFTVIPFTLALATTSKVTKIVSKVSDYEDITERIVMGVLIVFVFYFSTSHIKTVDDKKISQSNFQNWVRPLLYKGAEFAGVAEKGATRSFLTYRMKNSGLNTEEEFNRMKSERSVLKIEVENLRDFMQNCFDTYKTDKLKETVGRVSSLNMIFPPSEDISRYSKLLESEAQINFYSTGEYGFLKKSQFSEQSGIYSVSACYKIERMILTKRSELKKYNTKIARYAKAIQDEVLENQIAGIFDISFRNNAELGFVGITNIITLAVGMDNIGLMQDENELKSREEFLINYRSSGDYKVGSITKDEGFINRQLNWIVSNSAYLMLPFADTTKKTISEFLRSGDSGVSNTVVNKITNFIPSSFLTKTILSTLGSLLVVVVSTVVTILIMMFILSYLPLIAISTASFSVIALYYFSVELFYLASPFVIVFAFATSQLEIVKNVLKTGLNIAFKPLLLVISVVMALFVMELFAGLNSMLIDTQFESLFMLTETLVNNDSTMFSDSKNGLTDLGFIFIKGILHIASTILSTLVCFYLVLNGSNLILDFFGVRDSGVDVQSSLGDKAHQKTGKYDGVGV